MISKLSEVLSRKLSVENKVKDVDARILERTIDLNKERLSISCELHNVQKELRSLVLNKEIYILYRIIVIIIARL